EMQTQIADAQRQLSRMQAQIADAQNVLASLHGQAGSAAILQTRGGASVLVAQLPPLRPGRVYQLWRIPAAGAPISAGLFTVDPQGYGQADLTPGQQPQSGETIAVTDEPQGGSAGPTTQPIVVGQSGGA
ncbi:MAG TPA: anti-sigma factor, partial [Roseiflexaceae bacterium]